MNPRAEYEKNIGLTNMLGEVILCFRKQNYNRAERLLPQWTQKFNATVGVLFESKDYFNTYGTVVDELEIMSTLKDILQTQEQGDYILLADLLELKLLPFLHSLQDVIRQTEGVMAQDYFEVNVQQLLSGGRSAESEITSENEKLAEFLRKTTLDEQKYVIEDTSIGCPTLKKMTDETGYYLHSNHDPVVEGMLLAEEYYKEETEQYTVFGFGLGYHVEALCKLCDGAYPIHVYENDIQILKAAFTYRNLTTLLQRNVYLHYDPHFLNLKNALDQNSEGLFLHAPSIRGITNDQLRESMQELFVQESSIRNQSPDMFRNFKSNIKQCKLYVDILKDEFKGKIIYLIAAGPSLDQNISLLKEKPKNSIIIAVGTAYRKLMNQQGIRPDYVMFLDAAPRMYVQATGFEQETIPYLMASTACRRIAQDYQGPKYLVCQEGYDEAEQYAREHGAQIYQSGGSVSTIAMDIAIRLGAKRVVCLGLDLAYTGNKMHATATGRYDMIETEHFVKVKDWNGNQINTSTALDMYRKWFEKRAEQAKQETPEVELINATEGGAYIKGLKHMTLREALNEAVDFGENEGRT